MYELPTKKEGEKGKEKREKIRQNRHERILMVMQNSYEVIQIFSHNSTHNTVNFPKF